MAEQLEGKSSAVTGAGHGIGRARGNPGDAQTALRAIAIHSDNTLRTCCELTHMRPMSLTYLALLWMHGDS